MLLWPEYQNPLHRSTPLKMDRGAVTVSLFTLTTSAAQIVWP